jgi:hypothetical protein
VLVVRRFFVEVGEMSFWQMIGLVGIVLVNAVVSIVFVSEEGL